LRPPAQGKYLFSTLRRPPSFHPPIWYAFAPNGQEIPLKLQSGRLVFFCQACCAPTFHPINVLIIANIQFDQVAIRWNDAGPLNSISVKWNLTIKLTNVVSRWISPSNHKSKIVNPKSKIEFHHTGCSDRSIESILLRDADALDFLGVVGVLRDFSKNPRDLRTAYEETKRRRNKLPGLLTLESARAIAAGRVKEMDELLNRFEAETFGCF
jgi:hypothetical protein